MPALDLRIARLRQHRHLSAVASPTRSCPNQLHILNVSFLVPTLRREFGGCAGNIAYNLRRARRRAGRRRGRRRRRRATTWRGCARGERRRARPRASPTAYTAQAFIITDLDNNQITAFHPGAMQWAHETPVPARRGPRASRIVAPDGRDAMLDHAAQLAAAGVPFIFDPGQGLPMFDGEELRALRRSRQLGRRQRLRGADARRAHRPLDRGDVALAPARRRRHARRRGLRALAAGRADGRARRRGERSRRSDRLRRRLPRRACCSASSAAGRCADCARLGNRLGALKIASRGGQNHVLDRTFRAQR